MNAPIVNVLMQAAEKIGARLVIEPQWRCVGQVRYASGVKRYFKLSSLDINTLGASAIARDKDFARFFLQDAGHAIPEGRSFLAPRWAEKLNVHDRGIDDAWAYAQSMGSAVFVKPNSLSQGAGVAKAGTREDFYKAATAAMEMDRVILVERAVRGRDYRVVVLDGQVRMAYERIPLKITGDGASSVASLLAAKGKQFARIERQKMISEDDFRLSANLRREGLTFESVPEAGRVIKLLDNANLSAGGTSVNVSGAVHPEFARLASQIAFDMGLRLAGIDLMVDGDISMPPQEAPHWVIEVNSAPGVDHYAAMGPGQKDAVADLYLHVLKAMERRDEAFAPDAMERLKPV